MAQLKLLLEDIKPLAVRGDENPNVESLTFDSRAVVPGAMFFAVRGAASDGHSYMDMAVEKGAVAVLCEELPVCPRDGVTYVQVQDSHYAAGIISSAFYSRPSGSLRLVGITGTNGKTTVASLLYQTFRKLGYKAGLISTVVYLVNDREIEATHTTPDTVSLNSLLAQMVEAGCDYCFMEVSSHSVVQHRIAGLEFSGGIFTNITHDHLDYHGTFAEYIKAKKGFFDCLPKGAFALANADDRNGKIMLQNTSARRLTYSLRAAADFRCRIVEMHIDGMLLSVDGREVWVSLTGRFNAYNLLAVYAAAVLLDADRDEVLTAMSSLGPVRGRFECVRSGGITAVVDYAHTPDALNNVIDTINEIRDGGGKLIVVVGCGGNRDKSKRPVMARIAAGSSDMAILTSDNPRLEDPAAIIEDMKSGLDAGTRYIAVTDRREAIKTAVALAAPGDVVLVAGKGHETYQDAGGVKTHFDDREEVRAAMDMKD